MIKEILEKSMGEKSLSDEVIGKIVGDRNSDDELAKMAVRKMLGRINSTLEELSLDEENAELINKLRTRFTDYHEYIEQYKIQCGLNFPDIDKQYETMLPEINKYLNLGN